MLFFTRIGLCGLVLATSVHKASAVQQAGTSGRRVWLPAPEASAFSGEIEYSFDTALNMTRVRFETSLASRRAIVRVMLGSPTVHTLIATYDFRGRVHRDHPDSVRLTLVSDEWKELASSNVQWFGADPTLLISAGDTVLRFAAGIAQRVDEWEGLEPSSLVTQSLRGAGHGGYSQPSHRVHIERTATASISICDYLALAHASKVHGTVAGQEFDLNESVIGGMRQFATEMNADSESGLATCR